MTDDQQLSAFEAALPPEERDDYRQFRRTRQAQGHSLREIRAEYAGRIGYPYVGKHEGERDAYDRGRRQSRVLPPA